MNHGLPRSKYDPGSSVPPCRPCSVYRFGQSTVSKARNLETSRSLIKAIKAINENALKHGIDMVLLVSARLREFASSEGPFPYFGQASLLRTRAIIHNAALKPKLKLKPKPELKSKSQ